MKISVIIPALNEELAIGRTLGSFEGNGAHETIVVDGGSTDGTLKEATRPGVLPVSAPPGRAVQMNAGAEKASGDVFLFLHADTRLPHGAMEAIRSALSDPGVVGGAFTLAIDSTKPFLGWVARMANLRTRLTRVPYGDQGIFVRRDTFQEIGGFPAWPLMEDVDFCRRLKKRGRVVILEEKVLTSPRRWEAEGPLYVTLKNRTLVLLFLFGVSPYRLKRWYEDRR